MVGARMIAVMATTVLAMPAVPLVHTPTTAGSTVATASAVAASQAEVPCPRVELDPPPDRPRQPAPPEHQIGDRELGGSALDTAGLVVPPGASRPPALTATTWLVADLDSGAVIGACGPHEYAIPASVQKLLLAAALMDELDPDEVIEVTQGDMDFEPGSSAVGIVVGGEYSIETLWLGLLLASGNDAANVLARVGGGEAGLAGGLRAMNEEAQRLGAYQTYAATPSGLDGPGQFTSAYDLALIARPLFEREDFLRYVQTERTQIPAQPDLGVGGFQIQNDNGLLLNYRGALGGKTGFTDLARHSFVGAAQRDGRRLVVTLLGAERQPLVGWQQAAALLDWGFGLPEDASVGRLVTPEEVAVAVSSTQVPTAPPVAAAGSQDEAAAAPRTQIAGPVNAGTVAVILLAGGVLGLMLLALASRRRRE